MNVYVYIHVHTKPIHTAPSPLNTLQWWSKNATASGCITWKQYLTVIGLGFFKYITKKPPEQIRVNIFFVILPLVLVQGKGRNKSFLNTSLLSGLKPTLFWFGFFFRNDLFYPEALPSPFSYLYDKANYLAYPGLTYNTLWFGPVLLGSSNLLALLSKSLSWKHFYIQLLLIWK